MTALEKQEFDLLVSDIHMPGNMELELIRQAPQIASGLPIVLLTGYPTLRTASAAVQLPVAAYLTKPLTFDELWKHARTAIARRQEYLAVVAQRKRLIAWENDLAQIEAQMKHATSGTDAALSEAYAAVSIRNALENLIDLKLFAEKRSAVDTTQTASAAELAAALQQTIAVLEQTKRNFKSKRLGELRTHLENVLEKNAPTGPAA